MNIKWTYETCWQTASELTTLKDFRIKYPSAYNVAKRNGWVKEYTWLKVCKNHGYWDYDKCYEEAKKYTKLADFIKNSGRAYNVSLKNKWVKDYTWLIKKDISQKTVLQFSLDGEFIAKYNGVREAARQTGFSYSPIVECCNGKIKSSGGYVWRYKGSEDTTPLPLVS